MRRLKKSSLQIAGRCARWIRHRDAAPRLQPRIEQRPISMENDAECSPRPTIEGLRQRINLGMKSQVFSGQQHQNSFHNSTIREDVEVQPPDQFYDLIKFEESVAAQARILRDRVLNDTEEVLRKKSKGDRLKYMELAFRGSRAAPSLPQIAELLKKVSLKSDEMNRRKDSCPADDVSAWVYVLYSLSESELQQLWSCGFVDADIIEYIVSPAIKGEQRNKNKPSSKPADKLTSFFLHSSDDVLVSPNLSERLSQFKKLYCATKLTHELCESISNLPRVDLSPTIEKVLNKKFSEISKVELNALESYEESKSVKLNATERLDSNQFSVSEAVLQRALLPSNQFLNAVSKYDLSLKKSLDTLERVKRHTLLDPVFQDALAISKYMEKGMESDSASGEEKAKQRRKLGGFKGTKDPFERKNVLTDIPFFYNTKHNVVPPHGRFSLPSPRLPRETRKILQSRRRKEYTPFKR